MSNNIAASYSNSDSTQRTFSFQTITRNESSNQDMLSLSDWLATQEIISLRAHAVLDQAVNKIEFSLDGSASDLYSLFKGLNAMSQPRTFKFHAVAESRSFIVEIKSAQEYEVKKHLSKIFSLINSEIRFKQVLRKVIINQEKFEREEKLLFNSL